MMAIFNLAFLHIIHHFFIIMAKQTPVQLIRNMYAFRYILRCFLFKDLQERYHSSVLGFTWTVLYPVCLMSIYGFIFRYIFKVQIENYMLYLLSGLIPWIFFVGALEQATHSIVHNYPLINKIYFPREILPVAAINGHLIHFLISYCLLLVLTLFQGVHVTWNILFLPLVIIINYFFILGLSLCLSTTIVFLRDIVFLMQILFQFLFFFCPIVYNVDIIPGKYAALYYLNPMACFLVMYRKVLLYGQDPFDFYLLYTSVFSCCLLCFGFLFFKKNEWVFPERA